MAEHPHTANLEEQAAGHEVGRSKNAWYHVIVRWITLLWNPHRLNKLHQVRPVLVRTEEVQGGTVVNLPVGSHLHLPRNQVNAGATP